MELDERTYVRFQWSLAQLRERNVRAREPLARHVEGKVWELWEESNTNIYRILYFFFTDRRIVLLHGFAKKTQKLPRRELDVALSRLARFVEREGGR
jgi:phage-related protein